MGTPFRANPYLDAFNGLPLSQRYSLDPARGRLTARYAWAIPNQEAIDTLADLGPLVEMSAGSGYWAWMIKQAGGDIVAYDTAGPGQHMPTNEQWRFEVEYSHVGFGGPQVLEHARLSRRALFLCWPPYKDPMAASCLQHYRGDTLAFIGEGPGGCTGDDAFWDAIEADWELQRTIRIPQWRGVHDYLDTYRRACPALRPEDLEDLDIDLG